MKKKFLFFIPLFLCGFFLFMNYKETKAVVYSDSYQKEQPPNCPYDPKYKVNTGARYKWINNHIYIQCEYGTWAAGGYDYFWLINDKTGSTFQTWMTPRTLTGTPYYINGKTVYRKETIWFDIGGAIPNTPTGYFTRNIATQKYFFNVSGTGNGIATFSHDYYHSNTGSDVHFVPSPGIAASAEDPITGFYYIINDQPTSPTVTAYNSTASATGNIDVTPYFTSNQTWYIHIVAKSYTGRLSPQLDRPLRDASLMKTLTLTGDTGINTLTGAGSYYPGQTVNINATLKPTGVKWKGWEGTGSPFTQAYSFTMPDVNISYKATTNKCSYVLELNGNGNTGGSMLFIG